MTSIAKALKPKWRVCVGCLSKLKLSDAAVKVMRWNVWLGGARCDRCQKRMDKRRERQLNEYKFR